MLPTSFGTLTAAGVVLARKVLVMNVAGRHRQRAAESSGEVSDEGETGSDPVAERPAIVASTPRSHVALVAWTNPRKSFDMLWLQGRAVKPRGDRETRKTPVGVEPTATGLQPVA